MNIFINPDKDRFRAGWRIAAQLFVMFLIALPLVLLFRSLTPVDTYRIGPLALAVGAVISTLLAAKGLDYRPWQQYGVIFNGDNLRQCMLGFILAGVTMAAIFLLEYALGWIEITGFGWQWHSTSFLLSFSGYLLFMIVVGFYEELVFRGYQIVNVGEGLHLPGVSRTQAVIGAVVLSSAVFGIAHLFNPHAGWISTMNIVLAGGMLAFPFVITGRLSWSIGVHIGWNFFQGGVFGFPVSGMAGRTTLVQINQEGPSWLTGGAFGPEAGIIGLMGMGIIIGGLAWYFRKTGQSLSVHPELGVYPSPDKQAVHN